MIRPISGANVPHVENKLEKGLNVKKYVGNTLTNICIVGIYIDLCLYICAIGLPCFSAV